MEVDGFLHVVPAERVEPHVRRRRLQAQPVKQLLEPLGVAAVLVVTGKLHAVEAHLRHLLNRPVEVLAAIPANGVKLQRKLAMIV